ncbi:MAG: low molecular weight protein arginine phosphatase [Clostridia bacterium]|nr:low molecular weight protein arginine phosphatase [Clostridia bacterium]
MVKSVLFVCTGNTCRSSMAEAIARALWTRQGENCPPLEFSSAGVAAFPGMNASEQAIAVMGEVGIDLTSHRSRPLNPELVEKADLILVMTGRHRDYIVSLVPEAAPKVRLLAQYAFPESASADISDPFGGPVEIYRQVALDLEAAIMRALKKIQLENIFL